MSYQVLARKWRPKSFTEVVGQEHVLTILSNALSLGRVHHAYLFSGTRGVGKTSIARLLAKGLNCEQGITANPCGQCGNCQDIEQGRFVDLLEIDAASRTKVEDTREIIDNIQYLPTKGRFKVYLIDEVHMLSRSSFNALLKTLEEPPEHVKFLLATTDPHKLPITILSRCLHLHLSMLDDTLIDAQLIKILNAEKIDFEEKAVRLLAKAANGSMRDALSLTDQAIALGNGKVATQSVSVMLGTLDKALPFALVEALQQADGNALMQQIESAAKYGADWDSLLSETLALLHQIALLQVVPSAIGDFSGYEERIRHLAQYISPNDVQLFYQILLMGRKELSYAPDKRLGVEMSFLRALAFVPKHNEAIGSTSASATAVVTTPVSVKTTQSALPQSHGQFHHQQTPSNSVSGVAKHVLASKNSVSPPKMPSPKTSSAADLENVSSVTKSILAMRQQLIDSESQIKKSSKVDKSQSGTPLSSKLDEKLGSNLGNKLAKNTENAAPSSIKLANQQKMVGNIAERIKERTESNTPISEFSHAPVNVDDEETAETYQWQFSEHFTPVSDAGLAAKEIRLAFEHEKTPGLVKKLIDEAVAIDSWSAEIEQLTLPPLVKQIAVNAFLEEISDSELKLHLRTPLAHLVKTDGNTKKLAQILSVYRGKEVNISVEIDDDQTHLTPLEVRECVYQKKLAEAKTHIQQDEKLATICRLFDARIDEESIRPV